jgi:hypothetical protein
MIAPPANGTETTTRIDCENTGGYNVTPGVRIYEYCPFCGHRVLEGGAHELVVSLPP